MHILTCTEPRGGGLVARVVGVDACKKGWVGFTSDLRGYFAATVDQLVAEADRDGHLSVVAIDIPIGIPVAGPRQADVLARGLIGRRAASVFSTPVREALLAGTHAEATVISVQATGKGLSRQAYALRKKILEVDAWARTVNHTIIEVHPEVCFATMAGHPLAHPKSTWAGAEERRRILAGAGIELPADIGVAGQFAAVDDVLDAAAASWTASRHARAASVCHPTTPEQFGDGHSAAIWA